MSLRKSALLVSLTAGVISVIPVALGQEQPIVEVPTARNAVVGEVTATSVNVRSGPAESYYPTMQLNKGDKVTVVGHKFDWLKILPPEGSFSYVAKIYVDRDGANAAGTVNRDDVLVRAGSTLNQSKAQPQTKLNRGAKVEILGEADEYYKVKPPEGAYLYVAKQFVAQAGAADVAAANGAAGAPTTAAVTGAAAGGAAATATEQGTGTDMVEVTPPKRQTRQQASDRTAAADEQQTARAKDDVSADLEAEFRKLETRYEQTKEQPLDEQPVVELLKGYSDLQANQDQLSATTRRMITFRVKYLQALKAQQDQLLKAKQEEADFAARQVAAEQQRKEIEQRMKEQGIAVYTAVGQLQTSSVQKDGAPLLRLVDPADSRTLVYIRTADAKQRSLVGKFVGVRGEVTEDAQLSVNYIEPVELEQVDPSRVLKGVSAKIYPPSIITRSTSTTQE